MSTNSLSRALLNYDEGDIKSVHYGDILIKYPAILNIKNDKIPYITGGKLEKYKSSLLENGDLIFADAAEDETVGKAVEVNGLTEENLVAGLHTIVARPKDKKAEFFLGYYINSNTYHRQLLRLIQGSKVSSISKGNLQKTLVSFPKDFEEQQKIGAFFKKIDDTITLHQRKLDKLKSVKQAYLSEMFPAEGERVPKRRFPGFTDDWELRKLSEFVSFYNGLTYSPNDVNENGTLVLRSSNVKDGEVVVADNVYVDTEKVTSENVKVGDIVVVVRNGSKALIGKHAVIKESMPNTVIGAFMSGIRTDIPFFVNALLDTKWFEKEIEKNMGATINQITGYMFSNMEFIIPSIAEQSAIGTFFSTLDRHITLHQRKLEKLKNLKKALLNELFV